MRRTSAIVLLAAGAIASAAAADKPPVMLGPFTLGMSLEQARAAAPELEWREKKVSPLTKKTLAIDADRAVVLGGLGHSIEIEPGYYGAYLIRATYTTHDADAEACQKMTLPVLEDLEARFGTFKAAPRYEQVSGGTGLRWQTQRMPNGGIVVTPVAGSGPIMRAVPHERVKAGARSSMIFESRESSLNDDDGPGYVQGYAEYRDGPVHVRLEANYERDFATPRSCHIKTSIQRTGKPPGSRTIELPAELLARQQTIGLRHHSLDHVSGPAGTMHLRYDCAYGTLSGKLRCTLAERRSLDFQWIDVVYTRINAIALPDSLTDPDNPVPLSTRLTIVIAPSDRRPIDFIAAARTPARDIAWIAYPDEEAMEQHRANGAGVVPIVCQIQSDGSLICTAVDAANAAIPPLLVTPSQAAAIGILRRYVAAPTLKSGAPSAGVVFSTTVDFGGG